MTFLKKYYGFRLNNKPRLATTNNEKAEMGKT